MKKTMLRGLLAAAGCALFAGSAAATTVVSNDFEEAVGGWTGNAEVSTASYSYSNPVGYPGGITTHAKVLTVEGTASSPAATTSGNPATVDMMVQIALPDEELSSFPNSAGDTNDIQIAVGVTTNLDPDVGTLKVYCKSREGDVAGWYALDGATYPKDSWQRVSFTFDYANKLCQIRVNGEPVMSANGYLTTNMSANAGINGSWYKLANSSATALARVQVIGCTAIDDVVATDAATIDAVLPALADGNTSTNISGVSVSKTWIEAQGITRTQATDIALDDSGMTVAQKYAAGYDVADGKKFELKDMTLSGSNATLKFNEADIPAGYKYVIETADNPEFTGATSTDVTGHTDGTATIGMGDGNVKYYRIRLVPASN